MKEQAEKLLADIGRTNPDEWPRTRAAIQSALEAAREEGRKEGYEQHHGNSHCPRCEDLKSFSASAGFNTGYEQAKAEAKCHDPATCPDCAKLKEQGAEELRVKVLAELQERVKGRLGEHEAKSTVYLETVISLPSLQPPAPAVPEWFRNWTEQSGLVPAGHNVQKAYVAYLAHAPKPDAGKLARKLNMEYDLRQRGTTHSVATPELTAAIQRELRKDG